MKYLKFISLLFVCTLGSLFVSCEETAEVDEYANWKERNVAFIDSIAKTAQINNDGKWLRLLSTNLNSTDIAGNPVEHAPENYVYCHIEKEGNDTIHPLTTVSANYRGRLIPTTSYPEGKIFDESYRGALNQATNKPVEFSLDGVIDGWYIALRQMVEGDIWRVYIPAKLGYGSTDKTNIPANSTLIFDINVVDVE